LEDGEDVSSTVEFPVPKIQEADVIPKSEPSMSSSRTATKKDGNRLFSSPLARRIAEKRGLDLTSLEGSGPRGRIVKADVENVSPLATKRNSTLERELTTPRLATSVNNENVKKMYAEREYEEISLDGMRKTVAARLTEAKQTIPHFYLRQSIGLDALLKTRNEINSGIADNGLKISINDFIIKASAKALQDVPGCNTIWAGDRLLQMKASDVAVAVAIDNGLFTPVIQDAELKTLSVISNEMKDLATRAKERKLVPKEYQGGSFAISNLGMFGIENFDAIINPPHGSILAVGAGQKQPIVKADGALASATKMSVTLSVDHRVIDGALGARFLSAIAGYIEKPLSMLV
jgi:pyruvate dehydrogenase E2 component (dihydrolipoamide acetyltransferase)